jgi:2,3-bisphosphoglycerate-independent phosphoglycerate mutase
MKYILIVPDGMADNQLDELGGLSPMQAAKTPNMDALAQAGCVGSVKTIPDGMPPGSDVAALSIMGYDPAKYYTGRAPLEAANQGIDQGPRDVAFRCNLITTTDGNIADYSAGEIKTSDAEVLMRMIADKLNTQEIKFYPGVSYRHLMIWAGGSVDVNTTPPHNVMGQPVEKYLPVGDNEDKLRQMIWDSHELLSKHEINKRRVDAGKNPANMIWLWGQGYAPALSSFPLAHGVTGTVISAVDLLRGIARLAGLKAPTVEGVTGTIDTNWTGKAEAAKKALETDDFVMIHIEAPDECGHQGDMEGKVRSIELVDSEIVGPVWNKAKEMGPARILILPDHYTPVKLRTHVGNPVPFIISGNGVFKGDAERISEVKANEDPDLVIDEGHKLIQLLFY